MMNLMVRPSDEVQERLLAAVAKATKRRTQATADQYAAIIAAHEAGVPVTHIASSAGMSRQYVHRIISDL